MRPLRLASAALIAAILLVPVRSHAQTSRSWSVCNFPTGGWCEYVTLKTTAAVGGTNIAVSLHNLEGQVGSTDNTDWSEILRVRFWDKTSPLEPGVGGGFVNGVLSGGATGVAPTGWIRSSFHGSSLGAIDLQDPNWPTVGGVRGCTSSIFSANDAATCTSGAQVTFSWFVDQTWDATDIGAMAVSVYSYTNNFYSGGTCNSDQNYAPPFTLDPACTVTERSFVDETVATPEPASLVLFATGMLGIAASFKRRRAK